MDRLPRYYPAWGETAQNMRFGEYFLETVGFLIADRPGMSRGPVGTFFVIQEEKDGWDGNEDRGTVRWMVTARHTIDEAKDRRSRLTARMRRQGWRGLLQDPINFDADDVDDDEHWACDPDSSLDLAVRPMTHTPANELKALPIAYDTAFLLPQLKIHVIEDQQLGRPVYFAGLAAWSEEMGQRALPIVRSGTVAATDQPGIVWATGNFPSERKWSAPKTHLIDVRSYKGFSGSPCWIQFELAYLEPYDELPELWAQSLRGAGGNPDRLAQMVPMTHWWGVFVAHDSPTGIGMVIPAERVRELLQLSEVLQMKKKQEKRIEEEMRDGEGPRGQSAFGAEGAEFDAFEKLARKIVAVPKSEIDEQREKT